MGLWTNIKKLFSREIATKEEILTKQDLSRLQDKLYDQRIRGENTLIHRMFDVEEKIEKLEIYKEMENAFPKTPKPVVELTHTKKFLGLLEELLTTFTKLPEAYDAIKTNLDKHNTYKGADYPEPDFLPFLVWNDTHLRITLERDRYLLLKTYLLGKKMEDWIVSEESLTEYETNIFLYSVADDILNKIRAEFNKTIELKQEITRLLND